MYGIKAMHILWFWALFSGIVSNNAQTTSSVFEGSGDPASTSVSMFDGSGDATDVSTTVFESSGNETTTDSVDDNVTMTQAPLIDNATTAGMETTAAMVDSTTTETIQTTDETTLPGGPLNNNDSTTSQNTQASNTTITSSTEQTTTVVIEPTTMATSSTTSTIPATDQSATTQSAEVTSSAMTPSTQSTAATTATTAATAATAATTATTNDTTTMSSSSTVSSTTSTQQTSTVVVDSTIMSTLSSTTSMTPTEQTTATETVAMTSSAVTDADGTTTMSTAPTTSNTSATAEAIIDTTASSTSTMPQTTTMTTAETTLDTTTIEQTSTSQSTETSSITTAPQTTSTIASAVDSTALSTSSSSTSSTMTSTDPETTASSSASTTAITSMSTTSSSTMQSTNTEASTSTVQTTDTTTTPTTVTITETTAESTTPATACPPLTFSVEAGVERLYISISYSDSTATNFSVVYTINDDSMTMTSEKRNFFLLVGSSMQTVDITITSQDVCGSSDMQQAATFAHCAQTCTNGYCVIDSTLNEACRCLCDFQFVDGSTTDCQRIPACVDSEDCGTNERCNATTNLCQCLEGYTMSSNGSCQIDQSRCTANFCQNDGNCFVNSELAPECTCTSLYTGSLCGFFVSPCASNPCINGACQVNQTGFVCNCQPGYQGVRCNDDIDECVNSTICGPNATCSNNDGSFTCTCVDGFSFNNESVCVENNLLRFGSDVNDFMVLDNTLPELYQLAQINIPFGERSFNSFYVYQSGIIIMGNSNDRPNVLTRPFNNNPLGRPGLAILSCFWDNFLPIPQSGGVFYQAYNTIDESLSGIRKETFDQAANRVRARYNLIDFNPVFVFIATWSNVSISPLSPISFLEAPSTFQAVLVSDGCDTYLMYLYERNGMLWNTRFRENNNALIGYSNGAGLTFNETQFFYRPDNRMQRIDGVAEGRYFYKLNQGRTSVQEAQCNCFRWYQNDRELAPVPTSTSCPSNFFEARRDRRYIRVVDFWFDLINRFFANSIYRTTSVSIWEGESQPSRHCFQPFVGTGPRCCYSVRFIDLFQGLQFGRLVSGPRASRFNRYQIPFINQTLVYFRNQELLNQEVNLTRDQDLVPRDQCCIDSGSQRYCQLFQSLRPSATSIGYVAPRISFMFGDPHITTLDGVAYTFNGLGEFFLVYAPGVFSLQGRTRRALNENNVTTEATVFSGIAGRDNTSESGVVEFLVNPNNASLVSVMVDGVIAADLSEIARSENGISLSVDSNGQVTAVFPSQTSIDVNAENGVLTFQLSADRNTLFNVTQGLLGAWTGDPQDDFRFPNGSQLNFTMLQNTQHPEILNGTLSESQIYPFGISWQISMNESLFNYTSQNATYATYNPSNVTEPPFLEELVNNQINTTLFQDNVNTCTSNTTGVVSTTCLYDLLLTNRTELAMRTLQDANLAADTTASLNNVPPEISLPMDNEFIINGTLRAQIGVQVNITMSAMDSDNDQLTFTITNDDSAEVPPGAIIDSSTGVLTWTPSNENRNITSNLTLNVQVDDGRGGISSVDIPIELCVCANNQTCLYNMTIESNLNYEIVGCQCSAAYSGPECAEDVNACDLSFCFDGVTCTDNPAPMIGAVCGPCPNGTEGDGINCTNINFCDPNPCQQNCTSLFNSFACSCVEGYELTNMTMCVNIDECSNSQACAAVPNSSCNDTIGSFTCQCNNGFFLGNNSQCLNIDECANSNTTCNLTISECVDSVGSFQCACRRGYNNTSPTTCEDIDECLSETTCIVTTQMCINTIGSFQCVCRDGYMMDNGVCDDVNECQNETLNNCSRNNTSFCTNTDGSFQCTCLSGYTGNGTVCADINECNNASVCSANSTCFNSIGNFDCVCDAGFRDVGGSCEDINECSNSTTNNCSDNATCNNFGGGFDCTCNSGFIGDGVNCTDINECNNSDSNNCSSNANCTNEVGSFTCACISGYTGDGVNCTNINECETNNPCSSNANCTDTLGSFTCSCLTGFSGDGFTCVDINECEENIANCSGNANCTNTLGSFMCTCNSGYTGDGFICMDINECQLSTTNNCSSDAVCTNTNGSFSCTCNNDFFGNGVMCEAKPTFTSSPMMLNPTATCLAFSFTETISYGSYQVLLQPGNRTENFTTIAASLCGLNPNTEYTISFGVLSLSDGRSVGTPLFSANATQRTDQASIFFEVTLNNEIFLTEYSNIDSSQSIALISQYTNLLLEDFNNGFSNFSLIRATFLSFRNGSTLGSIDGVTNSTDPNVGNSIISNAFDASMNFSNPSTIPPPNPPRDVTVSDITSTTALVSFTGSAGVAEYEIEADCENGFNLSLTSIQTEVNLTSLPINSICSVFVRSRTGSPITATALSSFTEPVLFTTLTQIENLTVIVSGTTAQVEFTSISRLISFNVTAVRADGNGGSNSIVVQSSDAITIGSLTRSTLLEGLTLNTNYNFSVVVNVESGDGNITTANAQAVATTLDVASPNNVFVFNVRANSFNVMFDNVSQSVFYTLRVFLDGLLINETTSTDNMFVVSGVSPLTNMYIVRVAYNTPALSDFSGNVSSRIWNVTSVEQTSISLTWNEFPNTNIYMYEVDSPTQARIIAENSLGRMISIPNGEADQNGLIEPGVIYTIRVSAQMFIQPDIIIPTELFEITQITVADNPRGLNVFNQTEQSLVIVWNMVNGAVSYFTELLERSNNSTVLGIGGVGSTNDTTATLTGLTIGRNYTFRVCSVNEAGSACSTLDVNGFLLRPGVPSIGQVTQTTIAVNVSDIPQAMSFRFTASLSNGTTFGTAISNNNSAILENLLAGVNYTIAVTAIYEAGEASSETINQLTAPPDVQNLNILMRESTSLNIAFDQSRSATSYRVMWSPSMTSPMTITGLSTTLTQLQPGTMYNISVVAINSVGESGDTGRLTNEVTRSVSPNVITFSNITTTSIVATWSAQDGALSYNITVVLASDGSNPPGVNFMQNVNMSRVEITGLMPGTEYNVSVATVDRFGEVPAGSPNTELTLPARTSNLSVTSQSSTSITYEWNSVMSATNYRIILSNALGNILQNQTTSLVYTASNLESGENYTLSVAAVNRNGMGMVVEQVDYTILDPFDSTIMFLSNTNTSITVNHTLVRGAVSYTIRATRAGSDTTFTCTSVNQACSINNLVSGTDYSISVQGVYSSGSTSQFGPAETFTTIPARPENQPIIPQDFSITITINPVVGATTYSFVLINSTTGNVIQNTDQLQANFMSLSSGEQYNIMVTATKITSYGNFTSEVLSVDTETSRAVPMGVAFGNVRQTQFDVSWNSTAGANSYNVMATPTNSMLTSVFQNSVLENSITLTGLEPGQTYRVTVVGNYNTGSGEPSAEVEQVTAPATPVNLMVTGVTENSILISWPEIPTATSYTVRYSTMSGSAMQVNTTTPSQATIPNLASGTVYDFSVTAFNMELQSLPSMDLTQITAPMTPTFMMISDTQTSISAMWSRPTGATSYEVEVFRNGNTFNAARNITEIMITYDSANGIAPGTTYTVCLRAGTNSDSSVVGIPQYSMMVCVDVTTDPGNTSLPMEVSTTSTSITVRWNAAAGATRYFIRVILMSDMTRGMNVTSVDTNVTVTGLMPGQNYLVSVQSFNSENETGFIVGDTEVQTNPATPTITISEVETNRFTLTWDIGSTVTFSNVQVEQIDGNPSALPIMIPFNGLIARTGSTETAIISNLVDSTQYRVSIEAIATINKRSEEAIVMQYTLPVNPQNAMVESNNASLIIRWDPSNNVMGYFVRFFIGNNSTPEPSQTSTVSNASFLNLSPSTDYRIEIFTLGLAGNSTTTSVLTQTTPSSPSSISVTATNRSIEVVFDAPPAGTRIEVTGTTTDGMQIEGNTTGSQVLFDSVALGVPYTFTLRAVDSNNVSSEPVVITNVMGPVLEFSLQVTTTSQEFIPAFSDSSSQEYAAFVNNVALPELRRIFANMNGFERIDITGLFDGSVIVQFIVRANLSSIDFNIINQTFQTERNDTVFSAVIIEAVSMVAPDPCENNPCLNGICTSMSGVFVCECLPGTQNVSGICPLQCSTGYCDPGATCIPTSSVGNPQCQCQVGRTGLQCTETDASRILAIVFGVLAGVILIAFIVVLVLYWRKRKSASLSMQP